MKLHMFADVAQFYVLCLPAEFALTVAKVNRDLDAACLWARSNSLILNPSKSQATIFNQAMQQNHIRP